MRQGGLAIFPLIGFVLAGTLTPWLILRGKVLGLLDAELFPLSLLLSLLGILLFVVALTSRKKFPQLACFGLAYLAGALLAPAIGFLAFVGFLATLLH